MAKDTFRRKQSKKKAARMARCKKANKGRRPVKGH